MSLEDPRAIIMAQARGAASLGIAFVGISRGLYDIFDADLGGSTIEVAAQHANIDVGYLRRWVDAAYAMGHLDARDGVFTTTAMGALFRPTAPGSCMPFAVQAVLGAHVMERASSLMTTGEQPGESVLGERAAVLPWFGPMLEASFAPVFARDVLPLLDVLASIDARRGSVVDLGCGNGWLLRAIAARHPHIRGMGLDGFDENIAQAQRRAAQAGLSDRLTFTSGDFFSFAPPAPVDAIVMHRALHHVWHDEARVFALLRDALAPGGVVVIWEPAWPASRDALRTPRLQGMAFQNLSEHVQGNHFLRPAEIEAAFARVGMTSHTHVFADGAEAVIIAHKAHGATL